MTAPVPPARKLPQRVVTAYGFGAVAYGVKDAGFGTFLLLFYNQAVGLPAATVGLVIGAALLIDAFVDPAVGFLSDRTRSRWGRRHPWMYASILPIMVGYVLLWMPPAASPTAMLAWLFVFAVLVRTAVSCYEIPSVALTAELSGDYDERTRILAWRYLWGWVGGLSIGLSAWLYFLQPTSAFPNGQLNRDAYFGYGVVAALLMGVAILVSALGTHRQIPLLPQAGARTAQTLREGFAELREAFRNRAFRILMLAALCAYINQGVIYALSIYTSTHLWGFVPATFIIQGVTLMTAAIAAFAVAPRLGKRWSKPAIASRVVLAGAVFVTLPYWLRLAGVPLLPGNPVTIPLVLVIGMIGTACNITGFILGASMMADVVEDSEERTGRRDEGLFFAGSFFVQKCTSGVGIFLAGLMLAAAGFPAKAVPGTVPVEVLDRLALIHAGTYLLVACLSAYVFRRFPFGRSEHEARLARLAGGARPLPAD
ncbi:MFS transporter [Sphingomonas sp.]|jgi:GPH family glycoside/pentoside/hexuronide:cation symporter|uniref:MFS transporter n=1 Tax=Sphingomonas sp. TaxID=28214 RepID=UPI002D7F50D2|nr:MFS transporter [Sphingomonas sp.]HEU0045737.1 MFS transporter [Sphingomonas sp.]